MIRFTLFLFICLSATFCGYSQTDEPNFKELDSLFQLKIKNNEIAAAQAIAQKGMKLSLQKSGKKEDSTYIQFLFFYGQTLKQSSNYREAETIYNEMLQLSKKIYSKENPSFVIAMHNVGTLYRESGNLKKADSLLSAAKAIFALHKNTHVEYYAEACRNLGHTKHGFGGDELAEELLKEALNTREQLKPRFYRK